MFILLILIHVVAALILIATILLQAGRGGGLSEMFGSSSTQTIFGTSATDFLKKATTISAIVFLCTSLALAVLSSKRSKSLMAGARTMPARRMDIPMPAPEEAVPETVAGQDVEQDEAQE